MPANSTNRALALSGLTAGGGERETTKKVRSVFVTDAVICQALMPPTADTQFYLSGGQ